MTRGRREGDALYIPVYRIPCESLGEPIPPKEAVGSKAHNLMRMARAGLPVPPGFVFGAGLCRTVLDKGESALQGLDAVLAAELDRLGQLTGLHFGDAKRPLLVSVRSGAAVSMPGMMETVLNIGLTPATLRGLARLTGNPRLGFDCALRLIAQFAETVYGASPRLFADIFAALAAAAGFAAGDEPDTRLLRSLLPAYQEQFRKVAGQPFPDDPFVQLRAAVLAVMRSWSSPRAQSYRRLNGIPDHLGTAVTVQAMVFGNAGPSSGAGVGFTRNPSDGTNALYIDYLPNAQGEDVVAGRRNALGAEALARLAPEVHRELAAVKTALEREFGDMQDFEFTVAEGRLYLLQSRAGKRAPLAALRIACDMADEGLLSPAEALARLEGVDTGSIELAELTPPPGAVPLGRAVPAGTGVAVGRAVFDPARVAGFVRTGAPVILIRETAETADIAALADAAALVTAHGARTSHAAVVARQLGKVCLVGCAGLRTGPGLRSGRFGSVPVAEGDLLSVDGGSGLIYGGEVPVRRGRPEDLLAKTAGWRTSAAAPASSPARDGEKRPRRLRRPPAR